MEKDKELIEFENAKRAFVESIGKAFGFYKLIDFLSKLLKGETHDAE